MVVTSFAGLLMMLLGGGATDLLDMVHTDSYWKAKQEIVSVEQLTTDAAGKAPADAAPAAPQAAHVRQLMAIRTLGERKQTDAVPMLKSLMESKEPFVADYAKSAIASIEGKPITRPGASNKDRMIDVWLLPAKSDLVAQLAASGKPANGGDLLGDTPLPGGADKTQMLESMTRGVLPVAELIGNARLQSLTAGIYSNAPDQPGYVVVVARGQYDSKAAAAALGQVNFTSTKVDDMEVFQTDDKTMSLILVSDTRLVLVGGDRNAALPLEAVVAAIKKEVGDLKDNAEMTRLIASVDTTQPVWAVVKMTEGLRRVMPPLAPFDTGSLVVSQKDDVLSFLLKAEGPDAQKVKAAVDQSQTQLNAIIAEGTEAVKKFPPIKPILEALQSIKLESDGGKATATGSVKGSGSLLMMIPMHASAQITPAPPAPAPVQPGKPGGL